MTIDKNSQHVSEALGRLLTQYKGKPKLAALIEALVEQVQLSENAVVDLVDKRSLDQAKGQQLDKLGTIVGRSRSGFDDDFYRILLYVQIGQNTSQGGPAKLISVFKLLTEADYVHYMNLGDASVQLNASAPIDEGEVNFVYENMQKLVAGGVRVDHIACFDATAPFSFSGSNTLVPGAGFSDISQTSGGKLAALHRRKRPFAFSGKGRRKTAGFGSLVDPLAGGTFVGIGG